MELERRPEGESEPAAVAPLEQLKLRRVERRQIVFGKIDLERPVKSLYRPHGGCFHGS